METLETAVAEVFDAWRFQFGPGLLAIEIRDLVLGMAEHHLDLETKHLSH